MGKTTVWISDNCAVARDWYKKAVAFREVSSDRQDDSGSPFADLGSSDDDTILTLVERGSGSCARSEHVILFAKNVAKAREWFLQPRVAVDALTSNSGGDRFLRLQDPEGNVVEVCVKPG